MTQRPEPVGSRMTTMDTLARLGIDDLAKLRIVHHFLACPGLPRAPEHVAEALGFRSPLRTTVALEQLARVGVLSAQSDPAGRRAYSLPADVARRLRATGAFGAGISLPGPALHVLADRSLARVRSGQRPPQPRVTVDPDPVRHAL